MTATWIAEQIGLHRAGDDRCAACKGRGTVLGEFDLCAACRGWGAADPDPEDMDDAPSGALCSACGMAPDLDDPLLSDPAGHPIHWSHLAAAHQRYKRALGAYLSRVPS
jgi:hypothetical protein